MRHHTVLDANIIEGRRDSNGAGLLPSHRNNNFKQNQILKKVLESSRIASQPRDRDR